jgi:maleylpyruvate isomerase
MDRILYTYFRSSASYRVRIAMNLKGLAARHVPIHLNRQGGVQFTEDFRRVNHAALVPVLVDDGVKLTQSLAIMEYLDEKYPEPPLLPPSIHERARCRQLAALIACDIHPLNNLRVLKLLTSKLGISEEDKNGWIDHWISLGFRAFEALLTETPSTGKFCVGDRPTIADCCLVPQVFSAQRFNVDLSPYPTLMRVFEASEALPAFRDAHPARQPDAE